MKPEEQMTRDTLATLGEVNRLLREHAVAVERRRDVKSATTRLEVVDYKTGPMVEGFVDAEMENGSGLCWCLDVKWTNDSFQIEATLDCNSSDGTETLKRVPTEIVHDVKEFRKAVIRVTRTLLALESV